MVNNGGQDYAYYTDETGRTWELCRTHRGDDWVKTRFKDMDAKPGLD